MPPGPNYWDYLRLDDLLDLQGGVEGDDQQLVPDELLFIVIHQTYELWFKQVLRELTEAIAAFRRGALPEEQLPAMVHHLRRVAAIMRLAVDQFQIMETLTPQDFLGFRDKLVPASGFQSFQMRKLEILLGLASEQRELYGDSNPLEHIRKLAKTSPGGARAWRTLSAAMDQAAEGFTLKAVVEDWLERTPIDASALGDEDDNAVVDQFLTDYNAALLAYTEEQKQVMGGAGISAKAAIDARFAASAKAANTFLFALDIEDPDARRRTRRIRAGLLYIESHRDLPLLAWPRVLIDTVVEVEEQLILWRHRHARMVERVIGRRVGTGGSSGVEYLDRTTRARIFTDLWTVRTLLLPKRLVPASRNLEFYYQVGSVPPGV
jgi:tryptophan 2,3-dioxygenase